jgi:hypothetical protein
MKMKAAFLCPNISTAHLLFYSNYPLIDSNLIGLIILEHGKCNHF